MYINACARSESRTDRIARALLERLGGLQEEVKLAEMDLQPLSEERLNRRTWLIEEADYTDAMFDLARQFQQADEIVIAAPYWDLSFPAALKQYFEQPATPANPEWVAYMAYNKQSQWGYACFDLYSQDKEGNYINPDNLYYRVYLDDDSEPYEWTLTAADGSTYNTTDVPYAYIDDDFIGGGSTYHVFYYYMGGFENMGLQAVYDSDGEERTSDIVWSTTLGVKDVKANAAKGNTTYWNLAGSRVAAPGQGIYIMRTQNADGTVSTKKVMHK